ncbi:hypothetical protein COM96_27805 [Bacillus cereus]|uniref:SMP-30/Gluconolactonase/LRE-like region domain-containing protein n=1 Tax=Bacillus cereus TaxID=1396 RepID=A0A2A7HPM4_BACCE|nr:hypothetical protein COM96_27805 [Bacillus cereus]
MGTSPLGASASAQGSGSGRDFLYIGAGSDDTVKRFDADTGHFHDTFVQSKSGRLKGPRGLLFGPNGNLLVSNQNVNLDKNGNVLKYKGQNGAFQSELVRFNIEGAPFAPRGIILSDKNVLFMADFLAQNDRPGELRSYDGTTGNFLGNLDHSGFSGQFYPRGVVFGPDGLLYVSVRNIPSQSGGYVVRFDPLTGFIGEFVKSNEVNNLHRPEGLVFGPDGNLYITSFRLNKNDTDKILVFEGSTGKFLDQIDLDTVGEPRAFAQAILFGPAGKLFVPITGDGPDTGSVRRYDVQSKTFDVFVPPASEGGPLGQPWYLTFGNTNPATLAYQ